MERKSFLKTFVKRIEVDYPNVTIYYTIPLDTKKAEPSNSEVLPITWNGTPGGTRTHSLWLRRPTTSSLRVFVFIVLKAVFIFAGCDLGAKVSLKLVLKMD